MVTGDGHYHVAVTVPSKGRVEEEGLPTAAGKVEGTGIDKGEGAVDDFEVGLVDGVELAPCGVGHVDHAAVEIEALATLFIDFELEGADFGSAHHDHLGTVEDGLGVAVVVPMV